MPKSCFDIIVTLLKGQVKGHGQGNGSRLKVNLWRAVVDIRSLALPSAAKSNNPHFRAIVYRNLSFFTSGAMISSAHPTFARGTQNILATTPITSLSCQ